MMATTRRSIFIGVDLGTSACKIGIYQLDGLCLGRGRADYRTYADHAADISTQEPTDWWRALTKAIRIALQNTNSLSHESTWAIGLCAQMGTHLLLDEKINPIGPAITWQDTRSYADAVELQARFSQEMPKWLGMHLPVGSNWPGPRLAWFLRTRATDLKRARWVVQPRDYLLWRLTGVIATDPLSGRGALHMPSGEPATKLFEAVGVPVDIWPPVLAPTDVAGYLQPDSAAQLGLPAGIPVVVGCNDLSAALLGSGVVNCGQGFILSGTSEHIGVITSGLPVANMSLMDVPVAPNVRQLYGSTASAGPAWAWAERVLGKDKNHLIQIAGSAAPRFPRPVFLPYLQGERAPIWDPFARGAWVGLAPEHDIPTLAWSVLEGIAFSARHVFEHVLTIAPAPHEIRLCGSASIDPTWSALRATVLGTPLQVMNEPEAGCLGAAILAAVGTGTIPNVNAGAEEMVAPPHFVEPIALEISTINQLYAVYRSLYPALRTAMHKLAHPLQQCI